MVQSSVVCVVAGQPSNMTAEWTRMRQHQLMVQDMYDGYADEYDEELCGLGYRTPALLEAALLSRPGRLAADVEAGVLSRTDALDIGCGTGLMGTLLRARCKGRLLGCDLSARMLEVGAATRPGTYDATQEADVVSYLRARPAGQADLVVACEVYPYLRSLVDVVRAAEAALCLGGLLAFSVEAARPEECASHGWVERVETGRIAHSAEYVRSLATSELELSSLASVELRHDGDQLVSGFAVLMTKVEGHAITDAHG